MAGKTAPKNANVLYRGREENPVVVMEVTAQGGLKLPTGAITQPKKLGNLYFELRNDIAPVNLVRIVFVCQFVMVTLLHTIRLLVRTSWD